MGKIAILLGAPKKPEMEPEESPEAEDVELSPELVLAAHDFVMALESHPRDMKAIAAALRDFVSICDAEPHEEGEHEVE